MAPYLILFFIPVFLHFIFHSNYNNNKIYYLFFIIVIFFLFSVLRGPVGGDYKRYVLLFEENRFGFEYLLFLKKDVLFHYSAWFFKLFFTKFLYFQIFMGMIFFIPLFVFLYKTNTFFLGLIISIPIGIYLIHLGYIKQSASIAFTLLMFLSLQRGKILDSLIFFVIAYLFHSSSFILIILIILSFFTKIIENKSKLINVKIIIFTIYLILLLTIIFLIFAFRNQILNINNFFFLTDTMRTSISVFLIHNKHYGEVMTSYGFFYRSLPFGAAILISLVLASREKLSLNFNLYYFYIFLFILCLILTFLNLSTMADRIHFYSLPFQILLLSSSKILFNKNKYKFMFDISVTLLFLFILLIWLNHSIFSITNWQPYQLNSILYFMK